jgi:hypothetical protein
LQPKARAYLDFGKEQIYRETRKMLDDKEKRPGWRTLARSKLRAETPCEISLPKPGAIAPVNVFNCALF